MNSNSVNTNYYINHSQGLLATDLSCLYRRERERETCLPHRNRNSHSSRPRRGGVDMPVEVSIVLTLVINKPLTGSACWGLGCHNIRERERHVCHTEIETHIVHAGVVSTCLYIEVLV